MFDSTRIKQDFSRAAAIYDDKAVLQKRVLASLLEKVKPLIAPHASILDAGCGTGQFARRQESKAMSAIIDNITQLDISYGMCRKACENGSAVVNADICALPFADDVFDVVFSSLALQWLSDWQRGFQEMHRVLKPEGVLAVSSFGENTLRELRASFAEFDNAPHVSPFMRPDAAWQKETITEYYPDLTSIMRGLKDIGAGNKVTGRRKAMMTPGKMKKVEDFYRVNFGGIAGLPVTWEVLYRVEKNDRRIINAI